MHDTLQPVAQGLSGLPVAHETQQTALHYLEQWLTGPPFVPYRPQLEWLIAQQRWSLLLDSFYRMLPFGTGGRRGPVGLGTNRFNAWTLASSVPGWNAAPPSVIATPLPEAPLARNGPGTARLSSEVTVQRGNCLGRIFRPRRVPRARPDGRDAGGGGYREAAPRGGT